MDNGSDLESGGYSGQDGSDGSPKQEDSNASTEEDDTEQDDSNESTEEEDSED